MNFDAAVAQLSSTHTWCDGAEALAKLGDPRALLPLVQAYQRHEEVSKVCLLDAMEALDAVHGSHALWESGEKISALRLMSLFPDETHLPILVVALDDTDVSVQFAAARGLGTQFQTAAWIRTMSGLLEHSRVDVRKIAIEGLGKRREPEAKAALKAHLPNETDPALAAQLTLLAGP